MSCESKVSRISFAMTSEHASLISEGFTMAGQLAATADVKGPSKRLTG